MFAVLLNGCSTTSLIKQVGGMDSIRSLSSGFLKNVSGDSRVSSLLGGKDISALTSKLTDQICSMTGGDCKAPLTGAQIADASKRVNPSTSQALSENFSKAVDTITSTPAVKDAINKTVGSKIGGILGALL
jgi:hypothetical protein